MAPSAGALRRATIVLLCAALIWGSMIPVLATLAQHYDIWLLSGARYLLGLPVLWLAVLLSAPPFAHELPYPALPPKVLLTIHTGRAGPAPAATRMRVPSP